MNKNHLAPFLAGDMALKFLSFSFNFFSFLLLVSLSQMSSANRECRHNNSQENGCKA